MNRVDYERQLDAVTRHIYEHLDEDLTHARLAEVARFSDFHWHRVYRSFRGETAAATVRRLRLQRAAGWLANSDRSIAWISRSSGFSSVPVFTRAFSTAYGMPPARYRVDGPHASFREAPGLESVCLDFEVDLRHSPARSLVGLSHSGSYLDIGRTFTHVVDRLALDADPSVGRMFALYFDDADLVREPDLRSFAAVEVPAARPVPDGLQRVTVTAGRYAVLRYVGPYSSMHLAYRWFFGPWLVQSAEALRDDPVYEEYLNDPSTTPPRELRTNIWMPLLDKGHHPQRRPTTA